MNQRIRKLAAGLLLCYLVLFVQLNVLQVGKEQKLTADPRNTREVEKEFNKPRGQIVTADGVVLAESVPATDGYAFQRTYPTKELFGDVTGYYSYAYGATQLEKSENGILTGSSIPQPLGGIPDIFSGKADRSGSVHLTMRNDLQELAKAALKGREGSAVVLDPRTGAVLALYSEPSYDPGLIATHNTADAAKWLDYFNAVPSKPLLANAYQERYMPGSTFKVVTTTAALEAGIVDPTTVFPVESQYIPPQTTNPIQNYGGHSCGGTFADVFARSCNTFFARLAVTLGPEKMVAKVDAFGLNEAPPFDLPKPAASHFGQVADFSGNTPLLAIRGFGQNEDAVTPLQMAMIAATVANGGRTMVPHVIDTEVDHQGKVVKQTQPAVWKTPMLPATAATLTQLMIGVVNTGTAKGHLVLANGVQAAAKTGTAQLNAEGQPQRSHAWIMAFAPAEAPRVAVAVMLKGVNDEISAGTGGILAGPIASQLLDQALVDVPQ